MCRIQLDVGVSAIVVVCFADFIGSPHRNLCKSNTEFCSGEKCVSPLQEFDIY
jgi:hypothetical protein